MRKLAFALATVLAWSGTAAADPCAVTGKPTLAKTAALAVGSSASAFAKFTGQPVALTATVGSGRAKVKTGDGFRIEGTMDPTDVPFFAAKPIAVVPARVMIGAGQRLRVVSATDDAVKVAAAASAPIDQTLEARATCGELSLDPVRGKKDPPPDGARGWVAKKAPLDLFESATGDKVFAFTSESIKDALLFWGTETRGNRVHVFLSGDVVVDAWASVGDLKALPPGEMLGAIATEITTTTAPRLAFDGSVRKVKTTKLLTVREKGDDAAQAIGQVDPDTEVLVLETVLGYSNVIPASLVMMPVEGRGFWVKAKDLG